MDRLISLLAVFCLVANGLYAQPSCNPQGADECADAPVLCTLGELNGYSCRNPPPPNPAGPVPLCPGGGVPNNMQWWAFVAGANTTTLRISAYNCTLVGGQQGIQAGIYTDCSYNVPIFCQPGCWVGEQTLSGFTIPCQTYYVFIDGCNGSECDYTVEVLAGANPPNLAGETTLTVPDSVLCGAGEVCFSANYNGMCDPDFLWRINGDTVSVSGHKYCDTLRISGMAEICVKPVLGNLNTFCDSNSEWKCDTVEVINMQPDTIELPLDTICLEPDQEFFTTECHTMVPVDTGFQRICCSGFSRTGCEVTYCGDYYFARRINTQKETVVLCPDENFTTPSGEVLENCGNYTIRLPGHGNDPCELVIEYEVIKPDIQIDSRIRHCQDGKSCIESFVSDNCDPTMHSFPSRWIDGETGAELARNTLKLCVEKSGEYCLEVTPEVHGRTCDPVVECYPVHVPIPQPPEILGSNFLCRNEKNKLRIPDGSYQEIEWTTSAGSFTGSTNSEEVTLDLTGVMSDTIEICVRVVNNCGQSEWNCRDFFIQNFVPQADFTYDIVGSRVFFMATIRNALSYFWTFGDGTSSTQMDPVHQYSAPGTYQVGLLVEDNCYTALEVKEVTIRMTSVQNVATDAWLEVFPNPGDGLFTIRSEDQRLLTGPARLRVLNVHGQLFNDLEIQGQQLPDGLKIDISDAPGGIYYLMLEGDGVFICERVVIIK